MAGESKGDRVPLAVVSKGGDAALAGGIQRRAEPSVAGRIQRNRRFRGTRLCSQSLVCYTFGDRGWRKGVVRDRNKRFQAANRVGGATMASADFSQFVVTTHFFSNMSTPNTPVRPPRVLTRSFPLYLPHLPNTIRVAIGLCFG